MKRDQFKEENDAANVAVDIHLCFVETARRNLGDILALGPGIAGDGIDFRNFSTFDVAGLRSRSFPPILLLTSESGENP